MVGSVIALGGSHFASARAVPGRHATKRRLAARDAARRREMRTSGALRISDGTSLQMASVSGDPVNGYVVTLTIGVSLS